MSRRVLSLVMLAALTGCQHHTSTPTSSNTGQRDPAGAPGSDRYAIQQDTAPQHRQDVSTIAEPVPVNEPKSRYGNPSSYTVWGKTYHVLPSAEGYVEEGNASWYGQKFHGHRTSSGEAFDMYQFSAAHRSLPLPTFARVTNLDNGRSLIVRVNDRGPFHDNRILDLSWAAAVRLGTEQAGTGRVRVEALTTHHVEAASPTNTATGLYLQAGAFQRLAPAQALQRKLQTTLNLSSDIRSQDGLHRVWIGPYASDTQRQQQREQIQNHGFERPLPVSP